RERAENAQAAAATSRVEDMRRESERQAAEGRAENEATVTPEPAEEPLESRGDRAERLRQEAARAGIAQDYRGAIELLEEAAALNARDARIQLSLFSNYRRIGNRSRATRAVTRYLELRPDAPEREEFQTWLEMNAP
ncbi:MAG: tetratricopeptide (TPR) repeat protein, partial [Bradymonadia bacterium]